MIKSFKIQQFDSKYGKITCNGHNKLKNYIRMISCPQLQKYLQKIMCAALVFVLLLFISLMRVSVPTIQLI